MNIPQSPAGAILRPLVACLVFLGLFLLSHGTAPVAITFLLFWGTLWFAFDLLQSAGLRALLEDSTETPIAQMLSHRRTYCARGVIISLHGDSARTVYEAWGYRPWHILPDRSWWQRRSHES